jgi:pimeloyl-ACP methyl ester carboxylesterase
MVRLGAKCVRLNGADALGRHFCIMNFLKFRATQGLWLSCIDYGGAGGVPVLLMHGAAAHSRWWDFTAPALAGRYHVLALDRRGHGDSEWSADGRYEIEDYTADTQAVIEQWGLAQPFLIGHSGGGLVSIMYAARYPENVRGLVLIETRPAYDEEMVARMRNREERPPRSFASLEEARKSFRLTPPTAGAPPEMVEHLAQHSFRRIADGRWINKLDRRTGRRLHAFDGIEWMRKIRCPVLVVRAGQSTMVTHGELEQLTAAANDGTMVEIPNADHQVILDSTTDVIRIVREFLNEIAERK